MRRVLSLAGLLLIIVGVLAPLARQVALNDQVVKIGSDFEPNLVAQTSFILAVPPMLGFAAILAGLSILIGLRPR